MSKRLGGCDLVDRQVDVCLCVCMCFRVLTQPGGCTNSSRKGKKRIKGVVTKHYPIFSSRDLSSNPGAGTRTVIFSHNKQKNNAKQQVEND